MNSDAALDDLAFSVGLRLMGPDERRRLWIALRRDPALARGADLNIGLLEQLDDLLCGRRPPETLQDRLDLARAERERWQSPFPADFWFLRVGDLTRAGFTDAQARAIVAEVRLRVLPTEIITEGESHVGQFETA